MAAEQSEFLRVIRVWGALAWADGVIAAAEAQAMKKVVELADLAEEERAQAMAFLEEPVELSTEGLEDLSESAREGIYKAAVRLANVDLDLASEELTLLERLRDGLSLDAARARALEDEVSS